MQRRPRASFESHFSPYLRHYNSRTNYARNFKFGQSPVFSLLRYSCEFRCAAVFGPEISSSKYRILADLCGYITKIVESYVKGVAGQPPVGFTRKIIRVRIHYLDYF